MTRLQLIEALCGTDYDHSLAASLRSGHEHCLAVLIVEPVVYRAAECREDRANALRVIIQGAVVEPRRCIYHTCSVRRIWRVAHCQFELPYVVHGCLHISARDYVARLSGETGRAEVFHRISEQLEHHLYKRSPVPLNDTGDLAEDLQGDNGDG